MVTQSQSTNSGASMHALTAALLSLGFDEMELRSDPAGAARSLVLRFHNAGAIAWERYGDTFTSASFSSGRFGAVAGEAAWETLRRGSAAHTFARLAAAAIDRDGLERITLRVESRGETAVLFCRHSSARAVSSRTRALSAGGIRRVAAGADLTDALSDVVRLARAMTYKTAAAGLPCGGSKFVLSVVDDAFNEARTLGFLAWCIDTSRALAGPDLGFDSGSVELLQRHTKNVAGSSSGPAGGTAPMTAAGTVAAVSRVLDHLNLGLTDSAVAVQGLGAVGMPVSEQLAAAGARVIASDVDPRRIARLRERVGALIEVCEPDEMLGLQVDVLVPAAVGGVIDRQTVDDLQCSAVVGPANNVLAAETLDDEIELAGMLHRRGILFVPDWLISMGGVVAAWEEHSKGQDANMQVVGDLVARLCTHQLKTALAQASGRRLPPLTIALEMLGMQTVSPALPVGVGAW